MKTVLAIFAGLFTGFILILIVEEWSHRLYPLPAGTDMENISVMREIIQNMPIGAFMMIMLAYALGSFGAGLVTSLLSKEAPLKRSLIVGSILLIGGISNLVLIPHPWWFAICSSLVYLPMAYAGHKVSLVFSRK